MALRLSHPAGDLGRLGLPARRGGRGAPGRRLALSLTAVALLVAFGLAGTPAGASHEVPWDATVNGQPFHGEGSPRLEGCTVSVSVTGLEDGAHDVALVISLTEPSGDAVLAQEAAAVQGTTWAVDLPLDQAVAGLEPHAHGHHVVVQLTVDGSSQLSRPFWLGCDVESGGNPFHVVFDVVWTYDDGTVLSGPPAGLDRTTYRLDGSSKRGEAVCTYVEGDDQLRCTYTNHHGHEAEADALIVPAGEKHTFSVDQTVLPEGWATASGLGTFPVRQVCPRDGGHDDGGHDDGGHEGASPLAHDGSTEDRCLHVVTNVVPAPPATTTTTTTPSTTTTSPPGPADGGPSPDAQAATVTTTVAPQVLGDVAAESLPATGRTSAPLAVLAASLVLAGLALVRAATAVDRPDRRVPATVTRHDEQRPGGAR